MGGLRKKYLITIITNITNESGSDRKILLDNIQGITKPAIRRLAGRGGVKPISRLIYEETRCVLKVFLKNVGTLLPTPNMPSVSLSLLWM